MKSIYILVLVLISSVPISCEQATEADVFLSLSDQEVKDLTFLREEEKLAYDVYIYAFNKYSLNIFNNISKSELSHTYAVLNTMKAYDLNDPVDNNQAGIFTNNDLQLIYDDLTAKVDLSENDALEVGATIEDLDINDIALMLEHTENADLITLYNNLICGSRNHLRSFSSWLNNEYSPSYISQEDYNQIINSDKENCNN